jgi:dTDP-4-amino-4,6-dideoxygalactose transaminase
VVALSSLAVRHRLTLIFDAAHAFGCTAGGRMIGNFGAAEVFSFHATKFINSFEGGALVTNDDTIARHARLMSNFGFAGVDTVVSSGTNAKMSEACAAMGLTSLDSLGVIVDANRRHYEQYRAALDGCPGIRVMTYDASERGNYQYVILEIDGGGLSRDDLRDVLWAENIHARRYFYPGCHRLAPYSSYTHGVLGHTDRLCERVLSLPTGMAVQAEDVAAVGDLITFAMARGPEIQASLGRRRAAGALR